MPFAEHARLNPDKVATVMANSGETMTYGELDARSTRLGRGLLEAGLKRGDVVAIFLENNIRYHEVFWAAARTGMYACPVNRFLTAEEAGYIVNDSGAKALITSTALGDVAAELRRDIPNCRIRLAMNGAVDGYESYESFVAAGSDRPIPDGPRGDFMTYSSGTTGQPKGIKRAEGGLPFSEHTPAAERMRALYGFDEETIYLSPAPLYHTAPIGFTTNVHSFGGQAVIMERFDALKALELIQTRKVTHSQWVPTMFVRMLKLEAAARAEFDLSSHKVAIHAAAPCPAEVKRQMIDWWGPIIHEYYGGTELNGMTYISSQEWLTHPGSVGRATLGTPHICDETGAELPTGAAGIIYFERDRMPFEYHNAPEKTEAARHPQHPLWTKLGDIGYLDDEGYLYLTDRESFMIISGGVNIYPQEIEDCIVMHPDVADVAVFGVPNAEFGEEVKAVVQVKDGATADDALAQNILDYAADRLAHYKAPRSVDFIDAMPRQETGKLFKRLLKDKYWADHQTRIL